MPSLFRRSASLILGTASGKTIDASRLRFTFTVVRDRRSLPNVATIRIYNTKVNRASIVGDRFTRLSLTAGYEQNSGLIFRGNIINAFDRREGTESVLEFFALDGGQDWQFRVVPRTFASGTTAREMVRRTAETFGSISLEGIENVPETKIVSQWAMNSPTRDVMDELAETYGFEWSIQSGRIVIVQAGGSDGRPPIPVDQDHGMIGSPIGTDVGLEVQTLLNPLATPLRQMEVKSIARAGGFSGQEFAGLGDREVLLSQERFTIDRVEHRGDTRGSDWYSIILGRRQGA